MCCNPYGAPENAPCRCLADCVCRCCGHQVSYPWWANCMIVIIIWAAMVITWLLVIHQW